MTSKARQTIFRLFLGTFLLVFVATACNNKKDKKEEPVKEDTVKVEPAPMPPVEDTTMMDKDTADTRPVKPGE
jgi:hypothetical protein